MAYVPRRLTLSILTFLVSVAVIIGPSGAVLASSATWSNTPGSALWATSANWVGSPATVPGTGDTATFSTGSTQTTPDLTGGLTIGNITFDTANVAAYTIGTGGAGGQALVLNNGGAITMNSTVANNELVNAAVTLGTDRTAATYTLANNSASTLTVAGNLTGDNTSGTAGLKTVSVPGTGSVAIGGVIGDGGATSVTLTKTGTGTLTLNGASANTYTGATTVSAGTLIVDFVNAGTPTDLINSGSTLVIGSGGAIQIKQKSTVGTAQTFNGTTINSGHASITGTQVTSGALTVTLGALTRNAGGTVNFTLPTGGNIATSTGNDSTGIIGTWATTGSGTSLQYATGGGNIAAYAGATVTAQPANLSDVTSATVNYAYGATASPTLTGAITANTLRYTGGNGTLSNAGYNITLNGLMNSGSASTLTISGTGNVVIGANNELVIQANNCNTAISCPIINGVGAGSLTYAGSGGGTLTLSGANTFSGDTRINAGTLSVGNVSALLNTSGIKLSSGATFDVNIAGFDLSRLNPTNGGSGVVSGSYINIHKRPANVSPGTIYGTLLWDSGGSGFDWNSTFIPDFGQGALLRSTGGNFSWQANMTFSGDTTIDSGPNQFNGNNNTFSVSTPGLKTLYVIGSQKVVLSALSDGVGQLRLVCNSTCYTVGGNGTQPNNASTFTGGTTINSGVLNIPNATSLGPANAATVTFGPNPPANTQMAIGAAVTIIGLNTDPVNPGTPIVGAYNAVTLTVNNPTANTFAGTMQNSGNTLSFTKGGAGTLTLSGATRGYTGTTTVSGGTLLWGNTPNVAGPLQVNSGGNFSLADGTVRGTSTTALTLQSGARLTFDWIGGSVDTLTSTAAATTVAGPVAIAINPSGPSGGPLTLISSGSGGLNTATYYLANNTGFTATLAQSATAVTITGYSASAPPGTFYWQGNKVLGTSTANIDNSWALSKAASNWSTTQGAYTATPLVPGSAANVVFSTTASPVQQTTVLGADMTVASVTINDSVGAVTIGGGAGGNSLTLVGTGTGASSAIVVPGTVAANPIISAGLVLGAPQYWAVASGKQLTVSGVVAGSSTNSVTIGDGTYTGTVILSNNNNTYRGTTFVNGGVLWIQGNSTPLGIGGAITFTGGTLKFNGASIPPDSATTPLWSRIQNSTSAPITIDLNGQNPSTVTSIPSSNTGGLTLNNTGAAQTLILTSAHYYTGTTTIGSNAKLQLGNGGTRGSLNGVGNIVLNYNAADNLIFNINTSLTPLVQGVDFGTITSGVGGVTKIGTGAAVLNAANGYSGTTTVKVGTLTLGANSSLGSGALIMGGQTGLGATAVTFNLDGYSVSIPGITYGVYDQTTSTIINTGAGTLTLNGDINAGDTNTFGPKFILGNLNLGGGTRTITIGTNTTAGNDGTIYISAAISNGGITLVGGNWGIVLSGVNTYALATTLTSGTLQLGSNSALGSSSLVFNGGGVSSDSTTARVLSSNGFSFNGAAAGVFGNATRNGKLTFGGTVDLGASTHTITCKSDVQIDGQIIGAGGGILMQSGTATLTIANPANTFTGLIGASNYDAGANVSGTIRCGAANVIPAAARITLGGNFTFDLNNYDQTCGIYLGVGNSGTTLTTLTTGTGTLHLNADILSDSNCYGDKYISGNIDLGGVVRTWNVMPNNNSPTWTIPANISNGGIILTGDDGGGSVTTVILSGSSTYASGTTISQPSGTMIVALGSSSPGWPTSGVLGTGTVTFNGGGMCCDTNTPRTLPNAVTFTGNGTFGNAVRNGKLTLSGNANLGAATRTMTVNSTVELSGNISGGAGVGIIKAGTGTLILSGSNSYPGTTTVNANCGLLQYNAASAIAGSGRNVTITATSATQVDSAVGLGYVPAGSIQTDLLSRIVSTSSGAFALTADCSESFDYSAGGPGNNFTALFLGAATNITATYSGTLTPNGTTYRLGGAGGTLIVGSVLAGSGNAVTVSGPGTVKFSNASNTYKGTTVNAGALLYAMATGSLGDTTGSLTVNGILDLNGQTHTVGAVTVGSTGVIRNGTLIGSSFAIANGAAITASLQGGVNVTAGTLYLTNTTVTGTISLSGGNLSLAWDGDGTSSRQTNDFVANVLVNNSGTITVQKAGLIGNAANKTLTLGNLGIGSQTLAVVNNNSFGLGFTGTATLSAAPTFNVPGGSGADVVQGLYLFGKLTGAFGFTKSTGTGTLVLDSASNDFGPGTITISAGLVGASADNRLGNAGNIVSLNASGAGILFTGTDTYAHQINTSASGGVIDVSQGVTATVSGAFNAGAANANNLQKNGNGTLVLTADNTANYTGNVTVNGGILRVGHNGALGAGGTSGASYSECAQNNHAAIEIQAGVTTPEYFKIRTYGINSGGAVRAVGTGTATLSGTLEVVNDGSFGADSGATLELTGTYTGGSTHNHVGAGTIKISCPFTTTSNGLNMYGPGATVHSYTGVTASQFNRGLALYGGRTLLLQATSTGFKVNGGAGPAGGFVVNSSTVTFDNVTLGAVANRLGGGTFNTPILEGATLNFIGGGAVGESFGNVTFNSGLTTLTASGGNAANILLFGGSYTRSLGGVVMVSSTGSSSVRFTTAPALTDGILPGWFWGNDLVAHGGNNTPFTQYSAYTTGNLGTTGSGSDNFNPTGAQTPVTSSKAINSLKLTGQGVTLNPGVILTLDTGMVINNGGGNITGGLLTPSAELIINNASAMEISSIITSGQSLTKLGAGTLTLSGTNSISGAITVLGGSLTLAGNNTLGGMGAGALVVNQGCTLDLGANNLYVANFSSSSLMDGNGGTVTGSGTLTVKPTGAVTFAGNVGGTLAFVKTGNQTLTMTSANSTSGTLSILGGGLTLKDGGAFPNTTGTIAIRGAILTLDNATVTAQTAKYIGDRINNSAITLDGGWIVFNGRQSTDSTESLGAVTAATGGNVLSATVGGTGVSSAQLTLASLTRNAGATIFFNQGQTSLGQAGNNSRIVVSGGLTGNLAPVNGVVPGAFYMLNTDNYYFLGYADGVGFGPLDTAGFPVTINNFNAAGASHNVSDPTQNPCVVGANKTINSLKQGNISFANGTPTGGSDLLTLASGMAILSPNTWGSTTQRGRITSGINELFLFKRDANVTPDPTINSVIVDRNGGTAVDPGDKVSLVIHSQRQDRGYYVHLTAPNLYSGGTFVDVGPLNVTAAGLSLDATSAGIVTIPAGGLTINNNCLVDMTGVGGQIEPSNVVTINGGGILNLMGANTLAGIVFNSNGGTVQPKVVPYNTITMNNNNSLAGYGSKTGTLTLTGSITCTPVNPAVTPLVDSGTLDLNGASQFNITVSALPAYPAGTGLAISSIIRNGGIAKLGGGVLELSAVNTFTGGLTINAGAVRAITQTKSIGESGNVVTLNNNAGLWINNTIGGNGQTVVVGVTGGMISAVGDSTLATPVLLTGPLTVSVVDPTANSTPRQITISGAITGASSLTLNGVPGDTTKPLILSSTANTYSGGTTINGGCLKQSAAGALGSNTASLTINVGGTLDLNNQDTTVGNFTGTGGLVNNNLTAARTLTIGNGDGTGGNYQGVIANGTQNVALTKTGTGTITLSGNNTYTGATTVSGGTLVFSGSPTGNSAVTVANATLRLDYSANSSSKINDSAALVLTGGTVDLAGGTHPEVVSSVTLNAGGSAITRGSGTAVLRLLNFTRNVNSMISFGVNDCASTTRANDGTGILGSWATVGGTDWACNSGVAEGGGNYVRAYTAYSADIAHCNSTITHGTGNVRINSTGTPPPATIALSAATTDINTLLQNWSLAATVDTVGKTLRTYGVMIGSGKEALTIGSAVGDGSLTVPAAAGDLVLINNSGNLLTINAPITANGASTLTTAGNVLLKGLNTYTGSTGIGSGTLEIGPAGRLNSGTYSGTISIGSGGTFKYNSAANQTLSGVISGRGSLVKASSGALELTQVNTYEGGTVVSGGNLRLTTNSGVIRGSLTINAAGTVTTENAAALAYGVTVPARTVTINGGTLHKLTAGTGNNDYTLKSIDMTGGLISSSTAGYYEFFNDYGTTLPFNIHSSSSEAVISANLASRQTANTFVFTTDGGTTPSGVDLVVSGMMLGQVANGELHGIIKAGPGVMAISYDNHVAFTYATGTWPGYAGATTISGGTLQLGHNNGSSGSLNPASAIVNNGTLAFKRGDAALKQGTHFNSVISGTGGVSQLGSGTTYLTGPNTYSGVTTITNGTLNVSSLANGGSASPMGTGAGASSLVISGGALQYTGGSVQMTDRLFTIGTAGATLDASGGPMTIGSTGGAIAFSSTASPVTLTLTGTGAGTLSVSLNNPVSSTASLTKSGTGTWTLTAAHAYSGNTTISGGSLYLNGANNSTPAISVASGATLGGMGSASSAAATVTGTVEAGSGGAGSLTLGGLALQNGSAVKVANIGNYSSSQAITVLNSGALTAAGTVTVKLSGNLPSGSTGTAHIIKYNGTFSGFGALVLDTTGIVGGSPRSTFTLVNNSAQGYVDVSYSIDYPVWKGAAAGTWVNNIVDSADWRLASVPATLTHYVDGDAPLFDDTATGVTTVNISAADVLPASVIFSNSVLPYTLSGSYGIAGTCPVIKRGTNVLSIANGSNNKFSGQLMVENGFVAVSTVNNAGSAGPLGNSALSVVMGSTGATGTLQYTSSTAASTKPFTMAAGGAGEFQVDSAASILTLSGVIDGSGSLRKAGAGTLVLSGNNNYGVTMVSTGMLQFAKIAALCNGVAGNWTPANIVVDSGAILAVNLGGSGEFTIGDLTTLLDSAHLAGGTVDNGLKSGSFLGIDTGNAGAGQTYTTAIANPNGGVNVLGLIKNGAGTLTLSTVNSTYTGGTIVNGGTLVLSGGNLRILGALTINSGATAQFDAGWGQGQPVWPTRSITINGGTLNSNVGAGNSDYSLAAITMQGGLWTQTNTGYYDLFNDYGSNLPIITLASATTSTISARIASRNHTTITFTTAAGTTPSGVDLLISGQLLVDGSYGIVKDGPGVMSISPVSTASTYSGGTTVKAGTLLLDLSGTINNNVIVTTGALTVGGGTLKLKGKTATSASQTVASLATTAGTSSTILFDPNGGTLLNLFITSATLTTGSGSLVTFDYSLGTTLGETPGNVYARVSPTLAGMLPSNYRVKDSGGTGFAKVLADGTVVRSGISALDLPQSGASSTVSYQVYKNAAETVAGSLNLKQTASQAAATVDVDTTALAGILNLDAYVLSAGLMTIAGPNTFGISAAGGGLKSLTMAGTNTVINSAAGAVTIIAPVLDNLGSVLSIGGAGTTILGGNSEFSGAASIGAGATVKLGATGSLPFGPLGQMTGATTIVSGGVLDLNGYTLATAEPLTINGTGISGGGALVNSSATAATYGGLVTLGSASSIVANNGSIVLSNAGTISGTYGLTLDGTAAGCSISSVIGTAVAITVTKNGTGTWTLSGVNAYTGTTTVNGGTLVLSGNNTCTGAIVINAGGTVKLGGSGSGANGPLGTVAGSTTVATGAALDLNGYSLVTAEPVTLNGTGISGGGALLNSSATTSATFFGPVTLGSASRINSTVAGRLLVLTGGITCGANALTIGGAGDVAVSGNGIGGTGASLTKDGSGTLSISIANSYTGGTTVNAGTLMVNNSAGSGAGSGTVTVKANATLGGGGSVSGGVTVQAGGHMAPGTNTVGTLTLSGTSLNLAFNTGAVLDYDIGGTQASPTSDKVDLTGSGSTITFGTSATLNLSKVAGSTITDPAGKTFVLFDYNGTDPVLPVWTINYGNTGWVGGTVSVDSGNKRIILSGLIKPQAGTTYSFR